LGHFFFVILIQPAVGKTLVVDDIAIEVHEWEAVETAGAIVITLATYPAKTVSSASVSITTAVLLIVAVLTEITTGVVAFA